MKTFSALFLLMLSVQAGAIEALAEHELAEVAGGAGITVDFSHSTQISSPDVTWNDNGTLLHLDNFRVQSKTASPLQWLWLIDADASSGTAALSLTQNQTLNRRFTGVDGVRFGTGTGSVGGFGVEYQGSINQSILLGNGGFRGNLALNLSNADFYHVEDGNQIALSNGTVVLSIPTWTAAITAANGLQFSAPFTLDITGAAFTHRSGGTSFSDGGTTFGLMDAKLNVSAFALGLRGGGAAGTEGLTLNNSGTLNADKSSFFNVIDDGNTLRFRSVSGTFTVPQLRMDMVSPDILRVNIGSYTAANVAASAQASQVNLTVDDVNVNAVAATQSLFGLNWNTGLVDAKLDLKAGGALNNGLRADAWWNSTGGEVRYLDEEGAQYFSFGAINTYGSSTGMTLDVTGAGAGRMDNGINLNLPNLIGDINIDNVNVSAAPTVWKGRMHYNMGLNLTFKPGGSDGTQGLRLNADWQIKNTGTDNTKVTFLDGTDNYSYENIGGTITITDATLDVTATNHVKLVFPTNIVSATDPSKIGSIKMGGVNMGSVQFRNFQTYLSAEMWGH